MTNTKKKVYQKKPYININIKNENNQQSKNKYVKPPPEEIQNASAYPNINNNVSSQVPLAYEPYNPLASKLWNNPEDAQQLEARGFRNAVRPPPQYEGPNADVPEGNVLGGREEVNRLVDEGPNVEVPEGNRLGGRDDDVSNSSYYSDAVSNSSYHSDAVSNRSYHSENYPDGILSSGDLRGPPPNLPLNQSPTLFYSNLSRIQEHRDSQLRQIQDEYELEEALNEDIRRIKQREKEIEEEKERIEKIRLKLIEQEDQDEINRKLEEDIHKRKKILEDSFLHPDEIEDEGEALEDNIAGAAQSKIALTQNEKYLITLEEDKKNKKLSIQDKRALIRRIRNIYEQATGNVYPSRGATSEQRRNYKMWLEEYMGL
jgi:hypothetical protein